MDEGKRAARGRGPLQREVRRPMCYRCGWTNRSKWPSKVLVQSVEILVKSDSLSTTADLYHPRLAGCYRAVCREMDRRR